MDMHHLKSTSATPPTRFKEPGPFAFQALAVLNIVPPEPEKSGSNAVTPIYSFLLLGMVHQTDLIRGLQTQVVQQLAGSFFSGAAMWFKAMPTSKRCTFLAAHQHNIP
jgi:hypothetical protein